MRRLFTFTALLMFGCEQSLDSLPEVNSRAVPPVTTPAPVREPLAETAPQPPISSATTANALPQLADLAERLVPSVVSIQVETGKRTNAARRRGMFDPFGGQQDESEPHGRGLGSGFLIDASGLVLTNNHVIENATAIEVTFGEDRTLKATLVGTAPEYDVALLKTVEAPRVVAMALGDSDALRIGDWVLAIGNPFGLEHSVSVGIISAKSRRDIAPSGRAGLYDFLQTDASINPGNSGGPLINMRGEVIGINSAVNAQGQGIGFAIPINMVKGMLPQLREGHFTRSWVGVKIQPLTPELAKSYDLQDEHGVLVADVVNGGPADKAGLKSGDVILEFDRKKLARSSDLPLYASMAGVGKSVPLVVWRSGAKQNLTVKLEAFPEDASTQAQTAEAPTAEPDAKPDDIGLSLIDLNDSIRRQLQVKVSAGAVVQRVEAGSPAQRAGLSRGDVITTVQGKDVGSAREALAAVKAVKSGQAFRLQVARGDSSVFVAVVKP
ncbi:MAG: Do family serine endopeptidase [Clostridia bacterium]|nr:Do family serine endopeptidase [Deltaproteobacteria bacterium]